MIDFELEKIQECIKNKRLCAINRDMIDELTTYCFPLVMSEKLILAANVYDFAIDGYKIMRCSDISEVFCDDAEEFNEMILKKEKVLDEFEPEIIEIQNFKQVFNHFCQNKENIIIQCEGYEQSLFYVGCVSNVGKSEIKIKTFDGCGIWDQNETSIPLKKITCVSYKSRYVNIISKYLKK